MVKPTITGGIRILALGGGLAEGSAGLVALQVALEAARREGAAIHLIDVKKLGLPMYDPDETQVPAAARTLADEVMRADGLIWASPLYHGTVSGLFKNALDWMELLSGNQPPYLTGKSVGLIATAGGTQGLQAINTMEYIVRALRGWTVPLVVPISRAQDAIGPNGKFKDAATVAQLELLGREVAQAAQLLSRKDNPVLALESMASSADALGGDKRKP